MFKVTRKFLPKEICDTDIKPESINYSVINNNKTREEENQKTIQRVKKYFSEIFANPKFQVC